MYAKIEVLNAVVGVTGNSVIATIVNEVAAGDLVVAVTNTGGFAFDAFVVEIQPVNGGPWVTIDVATPSAPCNWVLTALATLAAAASSAFSINVNGIYAVRLSASANTTATTASVWSGLGG